MNQRTKNIIRQQATRALSSVWLADGKMLQGLTHTGIYDRWYPVPRGYDPKLWQLAVGDCITDMLASKKLDWSIWYATFESDGVKRWVTVGDTLACHGVSNDLGDDVHSALCKLVESRNPKHVVSYGWLAIPAAGMDWDAMHDSIIDKFTSWNAFDREYCGLMNADRQIKEQAA